jgi:ribosomal-protein-alanine N-acetyltransferase
MGYAKTVIEAVFAECYKRGINSISLEVRESNVLAISLYQSFGFKIEGKRKDFYKNPRENAFVMIKNLD